MFINFFPTQYLKGFFTLFFYARPQQLLWSKKCKNLLLSERRGMNIKKAYSEYHSSMN